MIILGKIKVDDQVLKYCEISYDPFYVTVMSEDEKAIVDLFNNAKSIIVMDQYGLVIKSVSNYCGVESSTIKYNFYLDEENNMKPVITVRLNKSIAGTYKVKASNGLNLRYKPGDTSNSNLIITIPNGKSVANYGYYTTVNGVKWYLVTYKDTPGFVSSRYLVK